MIYFYYDLPRLLVGRPERQKLDHEILFVPESDSNIISELDNWNNDYRSRLTVRCRFSSVIRVQEHIRG